MTSQPYLQKNCIKETFQILTESNSSKSKNNLFLSAIGIPKVLQILLAIVSTS